MSSRAYARVRSFNPEETQALHRMARSRTLCAGRVKRAQILLRSNQGSTLTEITEQLGVSYHTAQRWIKRFNDLGISGLEEGPRPVRPRVYSTQDVGLVIKTALTPPDQLQLPFGAWTLDRLVTYLNEVKGISIKRSRISQIFLKEGLRWRQQEGWLGQRVDPDFAAKRGLSRPSTPSLR
ncbi:helix-turn-helix domain-containing protein [Deinococcus sp. HMF7604]|uniref:helix-turn-helix domain-containing protein n=1 Tax=Deinococcus betulae TaxID=2873312 RepID=UPI001CCA4263|nr:helix-turn-helix domain-containing protein [Deinococcus betulae]MBZ9753167.1 helix-turn-helix domain-containing protein [Deinococcus betulae]